MKKIKLKRLTLENFKGIKVFTLDTCGQSVEVFGDNATGKTTLFDAFSWLLFGKDSEGKTDFEIKTLDASGKPISGIDHTVIGVFDVNGEEVTLEKVYREKWVKSRGSLTAEFSGHETEHFVNGVPKSKKDYTAYIAEIITEDVFRLLTNPKYFSTGINKKDRREMLFKLCGGVTDSDVVMANPDLFGELADQLKKYTIDEVKAVTATSKRKINARLQDIPNRIDETSRYIKPVDMTAEQIAEQVAALDGEIEAKTAEYNAAKEAGTATSGARILAERLKEFDDQTATERVKLSSALTDARRKAAEAEETEHAAECDKRRKSEQFNRAERDDTSLREDVDRMERELAATRTEWQKVNASTYDGATTCPTCGQDLPVDMVAEAREFFNAEKARKLESITARGKELSATLEEARMMIAANHTELDDICRELRALLETLTEAKRAHKDAEAAVQKARADMVEFDRKAAADRAALIKSLTSPENAPKTDGVAEAIKSALDALKARRDELTGTLGTIQRNAEYMERVRELETEQHGLAAEYERMDKMDYIVGEFVKAKAAMIEKHINALFGIVNFRLFSTQVNGAVVDECDITVNGVPYEALNNAMQINAGIDVISTFCRLTETYAPIWIDNCESVTKPLYTEAQQIRLYVSADDKTIRYTEIF